MNDSQLRITSTHAADNFGGTLFGIQIPIFKWVALSLLAAFGIFAGLSSLGCDFMTTAGLALSPVAATWGYLKFGYQNRPPGYLRDLIETLLNKGHACPPRQEPSHPLRHG